MDLLKKRVITFNVIDKKDSYGRVVYKVATIFETSLKEEIGDGVGYFNVKAFYPKSKLEHGDVRTMEFIELRGLSYIDELLAQYPKKVGAKIFIEEFIGVTPEQILNNL